MILGLLSPFILLAYGHHLFWGKAKNRWLRWLPSIPSLKEGAYALIVVLGATVVAMVLTLPFVDWEAFANREPSYYDDWLALAYWFSVVWFVSGTYIYHIRHLQRLRRQHRQAAQSANPLSRQPKVDVINVELNQLRAQLGLHKMKTPRHRSNRKDSQ